MLSSARLGTSFCVAGTALGGPVASQHLGDGLQISWHAQHFLLLGVVSWQGQHLAAVYRVPAAFHAFIARSPNTTFTVKMHMWGHPID